MLRLSKLTDYAVVVLIRLAEGAARTASSLEDFNKATAHLRGAVGDLKEEVSRFTI